MFFLSYRFLFMTSVNYILLFDIKERKIRAFVPTLLSRRENDFRLKLNLLCDILKRDFGVPTLN